MEKNNIKYRAYKFGLEVIDVLEVLPQHYIYQTIGKQLLRSATSIGANIVEGQAGRTKNNFTNYYQIALKSTNETKFWLAILKEKTEGAIKETVVVLLNEAIELGNILGASILTLKGRRQRTF